MGTWKTEFLGGGAAPKSAKSQAGDPPHCSWVLERALWVREWGTVPWVEFWPLKPFFFGSSAPILGARITLTHPWQELHLQLNSSLHLCSQFDLFSINIITMKTFQHLWLMLLASSSSGWSFFPQLNNLLCYSSFFKHLAHLWFSSLVLCQTFCSGWELISAITGQHLSSGLVLH